MAAPTDRWKLGLFVAATAVLALAAIAFFGARSMRRETQTYVTYFDESVQGLDVGAPIKFRGVNLGVVGDIDVALDHRHVEVTLLLGVEPLRRLGLNGPEDLAHAAPAGRLEQDIDLRVQLSSAGLTGVKFLSLDFFPAGVAVEPELPFDVPSNYIPATASTLKNLEDAVVRTVARLPELIAQLENLLATAAAVVDSVREQRVAEHVVDTLGRANRLLGEVHGQVARLDAAALGQRARTVLGTLDEAAAEVTATLASARAEGGALTSVGRAADALGDAARGVGGLDGELLETLASVKDAARSLRRFTDALELEPDMLLHGREAARK